MRRIVSLVAAAATLGGCREHPNEEAQPPDAAAVPQALAPAAPSSQAARPDVPWSAASCAPPCCGGAACPVSRENSSRTGSTCRPGNRWCDACRSGLACIPGDCGAMLAPGERWGLRVGGLLERGVHDACATERRRDWICAGNGVVRSCVPLLDVCEHGQSTLLIEVSTADLVTRGVDWEVRRAGPSGDLVAWRSGARYAHGVFRRALCTRLRYGSRQEPIENAKGSAIEAIYFFLEPVAA